MAGSHFLLIYFNAKENERLWVKVEESLQTVQQRNPPTSSGNHFHHRHARRFVHKAALLFRRHLGASGASHRLCERGFLWA